ncbi:mitochondrial ribonuclease P catalytic subunit [Ischnura elegans]|uniref:mitochondrial ribonuclease P catalytic subunit n=1 Tax=Ischnura elegans TaxID=197161 RepID=UPI001ED86F72|nr:mitochondrial ribonuclease P catalytic subunit [Ischnura elegans]
MFTTLKPHLFRCSVLMLYRHLVKHERNMWNRHSVLKSVYCAIENNDRRYASHRPIRDVNSEGSDSDRENLSSVEEAAMEKKRPAQLKFMYEVIKSSNDLTEEGMKEFRDKVVSVGNVVTSSNIDAVTIGMCASLRNMDFADAYLNFLKQRDVEVNVATMGRYMKLCYICGEVSDESKVIDMYRCLTEKLPVMDASTAENIIHGLCVTSEWRRGLELMNMVKETSTPSASTYSALIVAAFRNKDAELGWHLMEECIAVEKTPTDMVYMTWLSEYCTRPMHSNAEEYIEMAEKLLNFLSFHELVVSKEISQKLKETFGKLNWQCRYTYINERGMCMSCRGEMHPIFISKSEFQNLSQTFLEKVLVGPDIFSKSSPEEVKAFQELITKEAPFNTVIDGLNVAYSSGSESRGPRNNPAAILQSVVSHFVDLSHKILVLGRTHMKSWSRKEMEYVRKNSQLFLAENVSQDDPFVLYATMSSGPATCFLSRDLMRGHAYRLKCAEPSLAGVFRRWQLSHQMRLLGISKSTNRVNIKLPLEFSPKVQKVDGNWHVPIQEEGNQNEYREGKQVVPRSFLDPPTSWLCISPKKSGKKSSWKKDHGGWRSHSYG